MIWALGLQPAAAFGAATVPAADPNPASSSDWAGSWIWTTDGSVPNSWVCFRKTFEIDEPPAEAVARIAVDSRYWLWINGEEVVFEGGLKRGPRPDATYHDVVELRSHLQPGENTIAVLVWYWGKSGRSHVDSGRGGLVFETLLPGTPVVSDETWRVRTHPAFRVDSDPPHPSPILSEHNVVYDASQDELEGWFEPGFDDSSWPAADVIGQPPTAPWRELVQRPIPLWRLSDRKPFESVDVIPTNGSGAVHVARLPYNTQVLPYLKVSAPEGLRIEMKSDNYFFFDVYYSVRSEYTTRAGVQEFTCWSWMNGHEIRYDIPEGVTVLEVGYREIGYDSDVLGTFESDNPSLDLLWTKAARTLYVNMHDTFMDCPDRERAQWWGDVVIQLGQAFYALDSRSHALARKGMIELASWRRPDGILHSPVPSTTYDVEFPHQMLASVGRYGFWTYYLHTGDLDTIRDVYPAVRDYLLLWTLDELDVLEMRAGGWNWGDWGENRDLHLLQTCWYVLALDAVVEIAALVGDAPAVTELTDRRERIRASFEGVFWSGSEYRSPGHEGPPDDRGNALAVLAGLAPEEHHTALRLVLTENAFASPYMEKYVLEALLRMGFVAEALDRMRTRYQPMINSPYSTLWETWQYTQGTTNNHAWAGGPLTLLSSLVAGIAPEAPGWTQFHVLPTEGPLQHVRAVVPTVKGLVSTEVEKTGLEYIISTSVPNATSAEIGLPKHLHGSGDPLYSVTVDGVEVWRGAYLGGVTGLEDAEPGRFHVKFRVQPATWTLVGAYAPAAIFADSFENGSIAAWHRAVGQVR